MRRFALAWIAFALPLALTAFAQEKPDQPAAVQEAEPTRLEVPAEKLREARTDWYGVYVAGKKAGFASMAVRPAGDGQDTAFEVETSIEMKLIAAGEEIDATMHDASQFDAQPPYRLRGASYRQSAGGFVQQIDVRRDGENFEAKIVEAGQNRTKRLRTIDYTLADVFTPEVWASSPRQVGDTLACRLFETSTLEASVETYTVREETQVIVDGVETRVYTLDYAEPASGVEGTMRIDNRGQMLSLEIAGLFELRLESEELAKDIDYSADLFVFGMAKIDQPLGDAATVARLTVDVEGKGAAHLESGPRQVVTRNEGAEGCLVVLGDGEPVEATPEEIAEALQETIDHPITHETVVALAKEAIADADTPQAKVERLVAFVDEYIDDDYTGNPLTVLDIIQEKRGDCTEHALLLTTLACAVGIPAREVTGLVYMGDEVQAFGGHAWSEVVLDGRWQPVDPAWRETQINATHIRFGAGRSQAGKMLSIIGGVSFKLRELERGEEKP